MLPRCWNLFLSSWRRTASFWRFFVPLDESLHQAKGLDGLHVLENLLVEGHVLAGELLVLLLIFPHLPDVVAGDNEGDRRTAQSDSCHGRVILQHDDESAPKADQHGTKAGDKREDIVDHRHDVPRLAGTAGRPGKTRKGTPSPFR